MKRALLITICLLTLLLCGCGTKEQNTMQSTQTNPTVTFINGVTDADVWLLPDTQANRKTTVWGTASLPAVKTNESRPLPLCEAGEGGLYLLRMIDTDGFYFAADGIRLAPGWTLRIKEVDPMSYTLEVTDESGVVQDTYTVFSARL